MDNYELTSAELQRIQAAKGKLSSKGVELGISIVEDNLTQIATKFEAGLINRGSVTASVKEGESYVIPKGFHNGGGTVSGVGGGGEYTLQSKTVTPTKSEQEITPDAGNYGLSDVIVNPIPSIYQDTSSVTAVASDVLATKVIVTGNGTVTAGTMVNNGAVTAEINVLAEDGYTIPAGYHSGTGKVSISDDLLTALQAI